MGMLIHRRLMELEAEQKAEKPVKKPAPEPRQEAKEPVKPQGAKAKPRKLGGK